MRPKEISKVLDLAWKARELDRIFNPLLVGAPGLGKSQIVQQWCKEKDIPFIDLRAAYLEAPDLIGFPSIEMVNGRQSTVHNIPEFWPFAGNGVLLLEEPNRGTTSVMNTFMQLLTDRKVHKYVLPKGWIIVGCINPENEEHDVNTMDAALKDRFEIYDVTYNFHDHIEYMRQTKYDPSIVNFVETKTWTYSLPEDIKKASGAKYISPRTLSKLDTALKAGLNKDIERITYDSILGTNMGAAFFNFKNNEQPVTYVELLNEDTRKAALQKLKKFSDPSNYKSGSISITIRDIVDNGEIEDDLLAKVVLTLPADQGPVLIRELQFVRKDDTILSRLGKKFPEVQNYLKNILKQG